MQVLNDDDNGIADEAPEWWDDLSDLWRACGWFAASLALSGAAALLGYWQ